MKRRKKKRLERNEQIISELWANFKQPNICAREILKGGKRNIYTHTTHTNFLNVHKH